ncbi:MAG: PepSY domain-containing protein, partial [Thermoleophilia bacterium]|nr:PepSY domain-containing protein [Thermoleophilia bacterium]
MSRGPPARSGHYRLRRLHRGLGIGSLVFVFVLTVTGIALNHSEDMALDQRYVDSSWLLRWYGIDTPPVESSFTVADHRATLMGGRLYFDGREIGADVGRLTGMVAADDFIAVAAAEDVFLLTPAGELVERVNVAADLPGGIDGLGSAAGALLLRSGEALYFADDDFIGFTPCVDITGMDIAWSLASVVPPAELEALHALHRGRGVSLERLLADLHSGRLFSDLGPLVVDLAGLVLIALSIFGLMMW